VASRLRQGGAAGCVDTESREGHAWKGADVWAAGDSGAGEVALAKCWAVLRAPAGKRLAPMLAVVVPLSRRDGELDLTDAEAALLMRMSAATIYCPLDRNDSR